MAKALVLCFFRGYGTTILKALKIYIQSPEICLGKDIPQFLKLFRRGSRFPALLGYDP